MTYLNESILQKPIMCSQFLVLVLISLTLITIQPSAVQAQWVGPNSNVLTTENNVGIGTLPQTNSQRLIVARRDQSQPSEIVIQNLTTTGSEPGAVFRAMADQAHIQFASWTSSRPSTRFGIAVGGWNEVIAVGGNGIVYGTFNNSPVIFGTNSTAAMHITTTQNVGIGINAPAYKLDVSGGLNGFRAKAATTSGNDTIATFENTNGVQAIVRGNGNVGIGTTSPQQSMTLYRPSGPVLQLVDNTSGITANDGLLLIQDGLNSYLENSEAGSVNFRTGATTRMTIDSSGNVGVGITTPAAKLDVNGNTKVAGNIDVTGTGNITAAGTIEAAIIKAKYQDVAEWVPSTHALPSGTLVTLDPNKSNHVEASSKAYDTRVAGVVSAQPGIALGEEGVNKVLVATTGRVRVMVDASAGPIGVGDLLVTSDIAGVAMKSEPVKIGNRSMHMPGTLIGKALEPLAVGRGQILVLLSLQ